MDYDGVITELFSLRRFGTDKGPHLIMPVLKYFGNPHLNYKTIHIVGTVGKGSTSKMIATILQNAGFKVGLFTSPHLIDFRERIKINDKEIPRSSVVELFGQIRAFDTNLKFFDIATVMAFIFFSQNKVDYAIVEAGMGARFDPTLVCMPDAVAITRIANDHENVLGDIENIIDDKTDSIRTNTPVFTIADNKSEFLETKSQVRNASLVYCPSFNGKLGLNGNFQTENAGIAVSLTNYLGISNKIIEFSLNNMRWDGRCQYISDNVLLDCAHNVQGIKALTNYVDSLNKKAVYVFAAMRSKNLKGMLSLIPSLNLICTEFKNLNCASVEELEKFNKGIVVKDPFKAIKLAKELVGDSGLVVICGSCYLAGEILSKVGNVHTFV